MFSTLYHHNTAALSITESEDKHVEHSTTLDKAMIHFYFCIEGQTTCVFGDRYSRTIEAGHNYFLYNPERTMSIDITLSPHTKAAFLTISLEYMHTLFLGDTPHFLNPENTDKTFYDKREIPNALRNVLNQLFCATLEGTAQHLYYKGKIMEILSLYCSQQKTDMESCPFLNNQEVIRKIRHAKEHILRYEKDPPSLKELAKQVGLNDYQLKAGFKRVYGDTVFGFLLNRKLNYSQYLLDTGKHNINDVAHMVGYVNPSHFIAAFKKKFGVTPKKYWMGRHR